MAEITLTDEQMDAKVEEVKEVVRPLQAIEAEVILTAAFFEVLATLAIVNEPTLAHDRAKLKQTIIDNSLQNFHYWWVDTEMSGGPKLN